MTLQTKETTMTDTNASRYRTFSFERDLQDALRFNAHRRTTTMTSLKKMREDQMRLATGGQGEARFGPVDDHGLRFPQCLPGPNLWDQVAPEDFGRDFDYTTEGHGSVTVITPDSPAALQWLYRHLPEDCPRMGALGFVIETNYVAEVLAGMKRDGLTSRFEYDEAMANEERDRHAGEGQ